MVEAVGNIFYNVNASNFEIQSSTPSFLLANGSGEQFACNTGNQTVTYNLNVDFINGFTETVNLAVAGNPVGSNVSFSNTTFTADNSLVMTISNLDNIAAQRYLVTVTGTSNTVTQTLEVALNLTEGVLTAPTLLAPVNNDTDVLLVEVLTWQEDTSAFSYDVEIAEDAAFNTVVSTGNVTENTYTATNLSANTTYFWRVKSKNTCTESAFSAAFSFTTEVPVYCASTFTDDAGGTEHITNVTFNSINNNSGNDTVDGYQDFTTINTNLFRAQTEQISVTLNTAGFQDRCVVFIDWNQDFVFDVATERYDLGVFIDDDGDATTTDEDTATFSITVPADAKFGTTRMRVVIEYDDPSNGSGGGPCSTDKLSEWGETEDYSITVLDSTLSVVDTNNYLITTVSESCLDKNDGKLNLDIKQNEYDYDLSIQGPNTTVTETITTDYSYALDNLSPGVFTVCLTATALNQQNCFDVVVAEAEQIALKAKADKTGVNFNIAKGTAPYSVFLDGKLLTTTTQRNFNLDVQKSGQLLVKTAKACEGEFATQLNDVQLLQNPIQGNIMLLMPLRALETKVGIKILML
jgi:Fibronectin type III domain.